MHCEWVLCPFLRTNKVYYLIFSSENLALKHYFSLTRMNIFSSWSWILFKTTVFWSQKLHRVGSYSIMQLDINPEIILLHILMCRYCISWHIYLCNAFLFFSALCLRWVWEEMAACARQSCSQQILLVRSCWLLNHEKVQCCFWKV